MFVVTGTTGKRDERECCNTGEDEVFDHISFIEVDTAGARG